MIEIEKIKWAEINELCRAGVRQLTAAGVQQVEMGESYLSKEFWIAGSTKYRYRPIGRAWYLRPTSLAGLTGTGFFLNEAFVLTDGSLGKSGVPHTRGGNVETSRTLVHGKNIARPLPQYVLVNPKSHVYNSNLPLEKWELGLRASRSDTPPPLLKEPLLQGIANALAER